MSLEERSRLRCEASNKFTHCESISCFHFQLPHGELALINNLFPKLRNLRQGLSVFTHTKYGQICSDTIKI